MPNHITTILKADPDVLAAIVRGLTEDEKEELTRNHETLKAGHAARGTGYVPPPPDLDRKVVDFEMVIPSPPNKETGGCSGKHEDGVVCWYEWNVQNWGTKWGAYDLEIRDDSTVKFETAWSHPLPVMEALSRKFPHKGLVVQYADEDFGANCDAYSMQDGIIIESAGFDDSSEEAHELAAQVLYNRTYADVKAEWDEDSIQSARQYLHARRVQDKYKLDNVSMAYEEIKKEKLDLPQDIIDKIQTAEDAEAAWSE